MAYTFQYNGVAISNPNIQEVSSEAVYDGADVSVMFTRTRYRVTGVVDGSGGIANNLVGVRVALLQPRMPMVATIDSVDITYLTFPNGDDVGGPKPRSCNFTEILGSNFALVNFEIEIGQQEAVEFPSDIISHNYDVTHSLDARFYTTRDIHGTIRVRQTAIGDNNPDALRGLVVPPLPDGFRRESMKFSLASDGLSMDYTITDKEVFRTAPPSATEANAVFTQQMSNYIWYSHFSMELKGHKNQDQLSMLNDIITVCNSRINLADPKNVIQQASIDEDLYDNVVRFQISCLASQQAAGQDGVGSGTLPADTKIFTAVPLSDANQNAALGPYGTSLLQAAKTAFYDPTVPSTNIVFQQELAQSDSVGTAPGSSAATPTPNVGSQGALSTEQLANPYTKWNETLEYNQDMGTVILPSTYAGASGKVYQMHNPYMVIKQYGEASRTGSPVQVPDPQTTNTGFLRFKNVKPLAPVLLPNKQTYQFGAMWYYEILVPFTEDDFVQVGSYVNTQLGSPGEEYLLPENPAFTLLPTDPNAQMKLDVPIEVDPSE